MLIFPHWPVVLPCDDAQLTFNHLITFNFSMLYTQRTKFPGIFRSSAIFWSACDCSPFTPWANNFLWGSQDLNLISRGCNPYLYSTHKYFPQKNLINWSLYSFGLKWCNRVFNAKNLNTFLQPTATLISIMRCKHQLQFCELWVLTQFETFKPFATPQGLSSTVIETSTPWLIRFQLLLIKALTVYNLYCGYKCKKWAVSVTIYMVVFTSEVSI